MRKSRTDITYGWDSKGVTAIFADGTIATGDILVGAAGPRSTVKELLLGPEEAAVNSVGIVLPDIEVKYAGAEKPLFIREYHPILYLSLHPDAVFSLISSGKQPFSHAYQTGNPC
jgi:hypothetical protein